MVTKSIRLTEEEASEFDRFSTLTGQTEATVLKRSALRGFRQERLDRAILAYLEGRSSGEAALIAGIPRAMLLWELAERGVRMLDDDPEFGARLAEMAAELDHQEPRRSPASEGDRARRD